MTLQQIPCQYIVARFVPDPVRDEPINVGVVLYRPDRRQLTWKFVTRFQNIRKRYPNVETGLVRSTLKVLEGMLDSVEATPDFLTRMVSTSSHLIRYSDARGALASDTDKELDSLYERYVTIDRALQGKKESVTREAVKSDVRQAFRKAEWVAAVMEDYLAQGATDAFEFDFAFFSSGSKRDAPSHIIEALSLEIDEDDALESARALAFNIGDARRADAFRRTTFDVVLQPGGPQASQAIARIPKIIESAHAKVYLRQQISNLIDDLPAPSVT